MIGLIILTQFFSIHIFTIYMILQYSFKGDVSHGQKYT